MGTREGVDFFRAVVITLVFSASAILQSYPLLGLALLSSLLCYGLSGRLGLFLVLNSLFQLSNLGEFENEVYSARNIVLGIGLLVMTIVSLRAPGDLKPFRPRLYFQLAPWVVLFASFSVALVVGEIQSWANLLEPASLILFATTFHVLRKHEDFFDLISGVFIVVLYSGWAFLMLGLQINIFADYPHERSGGLIGHPNAASSVAALFLIWVMLNKTKHFASSSPRIQLIFVLTTLSPISAIFASGTRSVGILVAVFALVVFVGFVKVNLTNHILPKIWIQIACAMAAILTFAVTTSLIPRLFSALYDFLIEGSIPASLQWRFDLWQTLGSESGTVKIEKSGPEAHSLYLQLVTDVGLAATIIFIASIIAAGLFFFFRGPRYATVLWSLGLIVGLTDPVFLWAPFTFALLTLTALRGRMVQ